ncbi:MAG: MurR/RpiR family transcriptional regulator [Deltaproteobacteria bacterium]|nr:MurR/RpiR family transcriptional regulator [Deltaproteobacteria bacterium]
MTPMKEQIQSVPIPLEVLNEISRRKDEFTPRQRIFAEYVLQNPESLAFLSITDLAKEARVSQATIIRFCNALGYDGYAQLAREAQQAIQVELGTVGRFRLVREMRRESNGNPPRSSFERVVVQEIENLTFLAKSIKIADFYHCLDMMAEADRICVIGCLSSTSLAVFFGYTLSKLKPEVDVIHGHGVMSSAICQRLSEKSLVFLIAFPRYPRETVELGELAASRGARIVAITNSHISPIVPLADLVFFLPVGIPSFVDAYASPIVRAHTRTGATYTG